MDDLMDDMLDDFCHGIFSTIFISKSDIPTIFQVLDGFQRSMSDSVSFCLRLDQQCDGGSVEHSNGHSLW